MIPPRAAGESRYLPIDAMRGIAALSVLFFHLQDDSPQTAVLKRVLPGPWKLASDYGRSGVAIFFVISGFVIAYTTRDLGSRVRDGVRFSIRRQVRLDPPYYLVIAGVVIVFSSERFVPGLVYQHYTPREVVLNMFYLQGIAKVPSILGVAWTLCLEVQFYLFVTLLVIASGWFVRDAAARSRRRRRRRLVRIGASVMAGFSLSLPFLGWSAGPWFVGLWWMFWFGMVLCWFAIGQVSQATVLATTCGLAVWCVAMQAAGHADRWGGEWTALLSGLAILALLMTGRMSSRPPRALLFFGAISYSLYLIHGPVIDTLMAAGFKLTGSNRFGAVLFYLLGAGVSVGSAVLLRRFVERPSMRLSHRLKSARLRSLARH